MNWESLVLLRHPRGVTVGCAIAATLFLIFVGHKILPDRSAAVSTDEDPRQYTVELLVAHAGPLDRKSVEAAGLRHLENLFLVEIQREGQQMAAVTFRQRSRGGDSGGC